MLRRMSALLLVLLLAVSALAQDELRRITILQLNDVYEISPLEGGRVGGLARVASLRRQLLAEDPNTLTVLAGDFLSPSVIGTLKDASGTRIKGAQMVDVLNALGLDLVTFGNHEFDIGEEALLQRIAESEFLWLSSNVLRRRTEGGAEHLEAFEQRPGRPVASALVQELETPGGTLRLGWIAVTLPFNKMPFVAYTDIYEAAALAYETIADDCDLVLGLTHLEMGQDLELARRLPGLALILGGHEHSNRVGRVGSCFIAKADANARTAYVHRIAFDPASGTCEVASELLPVDANLPEDPAVQAVVQRWEEVADEAFARMGFDPDEVVGRSALPLDGREASLRYGPTNLGRHLARALLRAAPGAEAAFVNSGAVRLDDELHGEIRQYDIVRTLPFGGSVVTTTMDGALLERVLEAGTKANYGLGGYPQLAQLARGPDGWMVAGEPLEPTREYRIATVEFLMKGYESNLGFLADHPYEPVPEETRDVRAALIGYIRAGGLDEPLD